MSGVRVNTSFDSSTSSQYDELNTVENEDVLRLKESVTKMLKSRIFLGRYYERRFTEQNIGYRDIVKLSPAEENLRSDLLEALHKMKKVLPNTFWIGISDSHVLGQRRGVCIWTEINNEPFGVYWFQIKSVKFRECEVIILLKCIRPITEAFFEYEPLIFRYHDETGVVTLSEAANEVVSTVKNIFTFKSIREFITFIFAFIIAIFTGSTTFVQFLGNFILALIRELSNLIAKSTPVILGCLDMFIKIVGGFYILIAMIFKPITPNPLNKRTIKYYERPPQVYDDKHFD